MKRKIIPGRDFCTYVKTPLIADDVHAYNVIWETGVEDKAAGMVITAKRSDGVTVTDYAATDGKGRGEYTLAGNMYSVTGTLEVRLSLVWETTTVTEKVLIFQVIEGSGNDKIATEDNTPILTTILAKATEAVEKVSNIPFKLSQFENDTGFISATDVNSKISKLEEEIDATATDINSRISDLAGEVDIAVTDVNSKISGLEEEIDTTVSIAKGANKALSFDNYSSLVEYFGELTSAYMYNTGQNVMIVTVEVPDLWISECLTDYTEYVYTSDKDFINELEQNGALQIGYYKFSQLETQKVDLSMYVKRDIVKESNINEMLNWYTRDNYGSSVMFDDYKSLISWFNKHITIPNWLGQPGNAYIFPGQYVAIRDTSLPDLIVSGEVIGDSGSEYEFTTNEDFINEIKTHGYVGVGYLFFSLAGVKNLDGYPTTEEVQSAIRSAILDSWEVEV